MEQKKSSLMQPNEHMIHLFFRQFGSEYTGVTREFVCILASTFAVFLGPAILMVIGELIFSDGHLPTARIGTNLLFILAFSFASAITARMLTVLFYRLRAPYDWLIPPLPLVALILVSVWLYVKRLTASFIATPQNYAAALDFQSSSGMYGFAIGFMIVMVFVWCWRMSNEKRRIA